MTSAVIIRNARKRASLTQTELAERLGKSQSEIGRWERGEVQPSFETLQRVVAACGLELVTHTYNADDSYDAQIERMLRHTPTERMRRSVDRAHAYRGFAKRVA
jgi:transcriptional regulator with XRE-family HTH domain